MISVMSLGDLRNTIKFWREADRIGPDIPLTHWRLHFKATMRILCAAKFMRFGSGAEFRAGAYAVCCSKINIGDRVIIRPGSMLFADPREGGASITIENDVMLGSCVHIYVHNHRFDDSTVAVIDQGYYQSEPVLIERGAWIGAGSIILPGVTIGRNAVVGAGSVVTKSIPEYSVAAGNPAKIIILIK
jgi:acetyltransferase-like isoleucine patch superfamily enzyme